MKRIKIAYIISTLRSCGPTNVLYNIVKYLNKEQFEIFIVTLSKEIINSREKEFVDLGVSIFHLNISRIKMHIWGGSIFKKIIDDIDPDIVHSHSFRADLYVSKYCQKYLKCSTIHNYPHLDYKMDYGRLLGKYLELKSFEIIKKLEYPIACSKSISDELLLKFQIRTEFIRNGIDVNNFIKLENSKKMKLKDILGIPKEKKVILSVGLLNERKNPIFIIEAFKKSRIRKEYILIFLGTGSLKSECDKLATDSILFLGNVCNVNDYLNIADFLVSASKAEGMPNAVLEAMSVGIPVLLSDIAPHKEIFDMDSNIGKLYSLDTVENLVEIFKTLNCLPTVVMSNHARKLMKSSLSAEKMSIQYQNKYIEMVKDNMS